MELPSKPQPGETKYASAGSIEKLTELINRFYYSSAYVIEEDGKVFNPKLNRHIGHVTHKRGRFTYWA